MAVIVNKLCAAAVARAEVPGLYGDGAGLYLQVGPTGGKSWLFRFGFDGHKRAMGLGPIHTRGLAEAREAARQCRLLLLQGIDPIVHREAQRATRKAEAAKAMTFAKAVEGYLADNRGSWRSAVHARQWGASLRDYALPTLGKLAVGEIETAHIVTALRPIWSDKHVTASRVRGRIEVVLDWAKAGGFRSGENPARWKGHLENILPKAPARAAVQHHAAMPFADLPDFMARIAASNSHAHVGRALEMLILTAVRCDELLGVRWDEIDPDAALWTIPAARTKSHREHRVPLVPRVVALLKAMPRAHASPFVFFSLVSPRKPLGASTLQRCMRDLSDTDATLHGMRSAFRDWCGDHTEVAREVAEAALGHIVGDKAERAYRRGDALDKRRKLMEAWAAFCGSGRA
jgi:integrase